MKEVVVGVGIHVRDEKGEQRALELTVAFDPQEPSSHSEHLIEEAIRLMYVKLREVMAS